MKPFLIKWSIRAVIVLMMFFATVLISRWVIALTAQQRTNTEQVEDNKERLDTTEAATNNHEQRLDGLETAASTPPPTTPKARHTHHVAQKPKSWWQRLWNP